MDKCYSLKINYDDFKMFMKVYRYKVCMRENG